MRVQLLSDLHFEFHRDDGRSFVESLDPAGVDVLVLAGDIAVGPGIGPALDLFCGHYSESTVVYVHGNHEFYGHARAEVVAVTRGAVARNENLVWLDASAAEIAGWRFLGAPLWFARAPDADRLKPSMNDFSVIPGFERWVYDENARALAFFESELRAGDVVVTHHLPSQRSVARRFEGHPLNAFFVCDVEPLIRAREPALWFHGHSHASSLYSIGPTRVACNPFGYARHELNTDFSEGVFFDL
jgi:predicted MPP superfamily phosphohydrolase